MRDLVSIFHTRIELRQIGMDEGQNAGAVWASADDPTAAIAFERFPPGFHQNGEKLRTFPSILQNLRRLRFWLMCCLKYEQEAYEDVVKRTPKLESLVETPDGVGTVNAVQLLREKVKVKLDNDPENPQIYSTSDIKVIRSGRAAPRGL